MTEMAALAALAVLSVVLMRVGVRAIRASLPEPDAVLALHLTTGAMACLSVLSVSLVVATGYHPAACAAATGFVSALMALVLD